MPRLARSKSLLSAIEVLRSAFLATVFCLGCAGQAIGSAQILKFGYILSPASQLGEGEKVFADEVAARTGGRYEIEGYPNAMLGGEVAMINDVRLGVLNLAFITGAPLPTLLPEAGIFNIPFLFRNAAEAQAVLDGPIGDDYLEKFDKRGVVALAWGENGMRHITNSKHPIRVPGDLAGLKLRLPQSDVMTAGFVALGADVQQVPFPQVYGALRSGSVDAQENPIATILSSKFYEVQKYLTLTGHVYDPAIILMSKDAFDALSAADKLAFKEAAKSAGQESRSVAAEMEKNGVAVLKSRGMSVIESVDKAAFVKRGSAASARFEKEFGRDAIARIKRAADASESAATVKPVRATQ